MRYKMALSVRQPWAHCIIHLGKDIENRTWRTNYRGRLFIHAAGKPDFDGFREWYAGLSVPGFSVPLISPEEVQRGGIIGHVTVVDCVKEGESDSPWFMGPVGFVLKDPTPLPFIPCPGKLGLFNVNDVEGLE